MLEWRFRGTPWALDPKGVELRLKRRLRRRQYYSKGPDFLWHIDSYDKLKQYGLCVSGFIDGFSRKITWVNVYKTSSSPRVIVGYYIEAVSKRRGCPAFMRGDNGTENCIVAQMKEFLSGNNTFFYGKSTGNQRIEMFWDILRKECVQYWIDSLGTLRDTGLFTGDFIDVNLIQFCCMKLLKVTLVNIILNS